MVQILPEASSFSSEFARALGGGFSKGVHEHLVKRDERQKQEKLAQSFSNLMNKVQRGEAPTAADLAGLPPELIQSFGSQLLKNEGEAATNRGKIAATAEQRRYLEKQRELEPGSLDAFGGDISTAERVTRPPKEKETPLTAKEVPAAISKKIKKVIADNPKATADELRLAMDEVGVPPIYSEPYTENRRKTEEQVTKTSEDRRKALRQETLPIRTKLAEKAQAATKGIQNKEELLRLVKEGDIDDPTFATLAEALPLNLGKRLLSNDTAQYKAGLVEEFGDLRNIFQGQTRIKEIDLLENKIADLYLTNEQKENVLKSRINALKADQILAESAAELEDKELGVLQFENELQKIAKPKLDALFNQILDEQKSIIQNAENRKKVALNYDNPEDKEIIDQIFLESGATKNNWAPAEKLAKKKGYTW